MSVVAYQTKSSNQYLFCGNAPEREMKSQSINTVTRPLPPPPPCFAFFLLEWHQKNVFWVL